MRPHAQIPPEGTVGNKIRVVVAHDHVLLRQGVRRLLEDEPDIEVAAEAGNAAEALRAVEEHHPEVVITDPAVFGLSNGEAEGLILQESPQSKVLFLTLRESDELPGGAPTAEKRVAIRQTSAEELAKIVREVHAVASAAVREMPRPVQENSSVGELHPRKRGLTAREREVLELLVEGKTVRSTAGVLGLSVKTVDAHKFNLMRKLGVHNKAELVMWAIRERVVKLPANY